MATRKLKTTDHGRIQTLGIPDGLQAEGDTCPDCGEKAGYRTCAVCGRGGWIIDCGHYAQPRPISPHGQAGSQSTCDDCDRQRGLTMMQSAEQKMRDYIKNCAANLLNTLESCPDGLQRPANELLPCLRFCNGFYHPMASKYPPTTVYFEDRGVTWRLAKGKTRWQKV